MEREMPKKYLEKNVLEAAFERLEEIFENFENIYFTLSGGKDSSVMVQLANIVAKKMGKKFDVLFIDLEAQYRLTIAHIDELKKLSQIRNFLPYCTSISIKKCCISFTTKMDLLGRRKQTFMGKKNANR